MPTLGKRDEFLKGCVSSLVENKVGFIVLVRPSEAVFIDQNFEGLVDLILEDQGKGLASAINLGIRNLPKEIEFVNWLGDDDALVSGSVSKALEVFEVSEKTVAVYGRCVYVDELSKKIWENRSGRYASNLIKYGPNLIPQPGSLFRRAAYESVSGLDEKLKMVFDLDLFLKLGRVGKLTYINQALGYHRWHSDTLTSRNPWLSLSEGRKVKLRNSKAAGRILIACSHPLTAAIVYFGKLFISWQKSVKE